VGRKRRFSFLSSQHLALRFLVCWEHRTVQVFDGGYSAQKEEIAVGCFSLSHSLSSVLDTMTWFLIHIYKKKKRVWKRNTTEHPTMVRGCHPELQEAET